MSRFEIEQLPKKPQEDSMQSAERSQYEEQRREGAFDQAPAAGHDTPKGSSLFYPLAEGIRTMLLKNMNYLPPTKEDTDAFQSALAELEAKHGADKIATPETKVLLAGITPFVKGFVASLDNADNPLNKWLHRDDLKTKSADEKPQDIKSSPKNDNASAAQDGLGLTPQQRPL